MPDPLPPYEGDQPFVFISYSHADNAIVLEEIAWLQSQGVRIWYDVGVSTGSRWSDDLAKHILAAESLVFFATPRSVGSENCLDEVNFALDNNKKIVAVHLEPTELPPGAALRLSHRQAIYRHELDEASYRQRLIAALGGDAPTPAQPEAAAIRKAGTSNQIWFGVVATVLVVVGGIYLYNTTTTEELVSEVAEVESSAATTPVLPVTASATSIAVLPFENLSPNPDDAYFAAGIHDEVLTRLAQIPELSVIARSSVLQYATNRKPATQVAAELGVGSVIEGTVRYAGDRVRISAQLIDGTTGAQLWSEVFERQLVDVFEIQQAIGMHVADALKLEFSVPERTGVSEPPTNDTLAYSHYLRALALWGNFQNIRETNAALDAAIARDPEFADAWAFKAMIRGFESGFVQFQSDPYAFTREMRTKAAKDAQEAARRALELDPNQAYAHMNVGVNKLLRELDVEASNFHMDEALRLRPQDYFILSSVASFRIRNGSIEEGLALFRRSVEINPADGAAMWWFSVHLSSLQRFDEAIERARHVIELLPDIPFGYVNLALIAARAGQHELARETLAEAYARGPDFVQMADIAFAHHYLGETERAREIASRLLEEHRGLPDLRFQLILRIVLGKHEEAVGLIERELEEYPVAVRADLYQDIQVFLVEEIRGLSRYRALVRRVREEADGSG